MSAHIAGKQVQLALDAFLLNRAISLIGGAAGMSDPRNVAWFFDDFVGNINSTALVSGWNETNTGSASSSLQGLSDEAGGVQQITTGATAASRADRLGNAPMVANANTKPWYCAFRAKITTAVTAQTKLYAGIYEAAVGGNAITAGFHGTLHATNFVAQYDGSESGNIINLGVAADTAYHVFELWGIGDGKLHAAIDYGLDLGGVALNAGFMLTSASLRREAYNGTDAVARSVRFDWMAALVKRS